MRSSDIGWTKPVWIRLNIRCEDTKIIGKDNIYLT